MTWVRLSDTFPEDPKIVAVGDVGMALYVSGLCYAARHGTGGTIPKAVVGRLIGARRWREHARKLVHVRLWLDDGNVYRIHNFEKWNGDQMARSERGRRAAEHRWRSAMGNARRMSDPLPDASETDALSLSLTDVNKVSPPTYAGGTSVLDDDDDEEVATGNDPRIAAAVELLAQADLTERQAVPDRPQVRDVGAWLARARERRWDQTGPALAVLAGENPHADAGQLVARLMPTTPSGERRDTRLDEQQQVMLAKAREGTERMRAVLAEEPDELRVERLRAIRDGLHPPAQ